MHAAQAPPPEPQYWLVLPGRQVLPLQQPVGQLVALQTHAPPTHRWPDTQAEPVPQRQAPAVHLSAKAGLQLEPVPQRQVPVPSQVSLSAVLHATQVAPLTPQLASALGLQVAPLQQPAEHDVELH